MILCSIDILNLATLITALSALLTGFYLWYDRRARLIVSIEPIDHVYCITIENVGKSVAKDIKISISKDFINSLPVYSEKRGKRIKDKLLNIQQRKFYFAPGVKKHFFLIQCPKSEPADEFDVLCNQWHNDNQYTLFDINVTYNGWYEFSESFFIDQFNTEAILYKDSLAKISDFLKQISKTQTNICKTLDNILNTQDNEQTQNAEP